VFRGEAGIPRDADAFTLWTRFLPAERVAELGLADNFWQMGDTGPCGRCSEIHFHRPELPCPHAVCRGLECDCDRFVEIWNNVFMEFERRPDGTLAPLPAPSIDTGMGLERITAVIQGTVSNYDTDLFQPLLGAIGEATGHRYGADPAADVSMRVVADHMRAMTFLIGDGVVPSNEWRGYVLRKIMRRAMRHGKKLGAREPFLHRLVDVVVDQMSEPYPDLRVHHAAIARTVKAEEERFDAVLTNGLARLEDVLDRAAAGGGVVSGDEAFRLYDSLGVPVDFIEDLAGERGLRLDREGFERALEAQRERARAASAFDARTPEGFEFRSDADRDRLLALGDRFEGYTTTVVDDVPVEAVFDERRRQVAALEEGQHGFVVLERTPFYAEAGGQVSDTGELVTEGDPGGAARVEAMVRLAPGGPRAHQVVVARGRLREGDRVSARVDAARRDAIRRNHTATHLLHAALRQVLGAHVKQAGSLVAPDRLRFDFVHFAPLAREDIERIERLVNAQIYRNAPVETTVMRTEDAMASGAMALFGEKYGDQVRVVSVPSFSRELCGGTHCRATGDIGPFLIVAESGVAAGVRRIEAVTGDSAVEALQRQHAALDRMLALLNTPPEQAAAAIERLQHEVRRLQRENSDLKVRLAMGVSGGTPAADEGEEVGGIRLVARRVSGLDRAGLRALADSLRDRLRSGVVVLASEQDGKAAFVVTVSRDLTSRIQAGHLVRQLAPIVGGGGGGRADFAEAGGKDPSRIDALLQEARALLERTLAARA
jgi:alanyl-tRNA synthetase